VSTSYELPPDLHPTISVAVKLASIAVHADELISSNGHSVDVQAIRSLLADEELRAYLEILRPLALLPVMR